MAHKRFFHICSLLRNEFARFFCSKKLGFLVKIRGHHFDSFCWQFRTNPHNLNLSSANKDRILISKKDIFFIFLQILQFFLKKLILLLYDYLLVSKEQNTEACPILDSELIDLTVCQICKSINND